MNFLLHALSTMPGMLRHAATCATKADIFKKRRRSLELTGATEPLDESSHGHIVSLAAFCRVHHFPTGPLICLSNQEIVQDLMRLFSDLTRAPPTLKAKVKYGVVGKRISSFRLPSSFFPCLALPFPFHFPFPFLSLSLPSLILPVRKALIPFPLAVLAKELFLPSHQSTRSLTRREPF